MVTDLPPSSPPPSYYSGAAEQRPKSPKVLGILSIIFASLILLAGLAGTCGGLAGSSFSDMELTGGRMSIGIDPDRLDSAAQREIFNLMKDGLGSIYTWSTITSLVFVAMSGWLLALGIGQAGYRRWARGQTVVWGWAAIAVLAGFVIFTIAVIGPAYQRIFDTISQHIPASEMGGLRVRFGSSMGTFAGAGAAIISLFVLLPYPIILLAFFTKDRLKQAMTR